MSDDIFENLKAPSYVELRASHADDEEADDSFFPASPEVEEVARLVEQLAVNEDPQDLSRMAMFGNRRPVKRRSQIRREAEETAAAAGVGRPVTRSQTRAAQETPRARQPPQPHGRATPAARPASHTRAARPAARIPAARPTAHTPAARPAAPIPVARPVAHTPVTRPAARIPAARPTAHTPAARTAAPIPAARPVARIPAARPTARLPTAGLVPNGPVRVSISPRPTLAFGSVVKPKPEGARTSVIRPRQGETPKTKGLALRQYPTPSGITPARPLTLPKTPTLMSRPSSQRPPISRPAVRVNPAVQSVVDRLSRPKQRALVQPVPRPLPTPQSIPNTYTHGINSSAKICRRRTHNRLGSTTDSTDHE